MSTAKASVDEVVQVRSPAPPLLATCDKENTDTLMAGDEAVVSVLDDKVHRWPPAAVEVASGVGVHSFAVLHFIAKGSYGRVYKALHNDTGTAPMFRSRLSNLTAIWRRFRSESWHS